MKTKKTLLNSYELVVICASALLLNGCNPMNYLRYFPLYSEIRIEHPEFIKDMLGRDRKDYRGWSSGFLTPEMEPIRERVNVYLNQHPETPASIKSALHEFRVEKGMTQEQALLIMGEPSNKFNGAYERTNKPYEMWRYDKGAVINLTFHEEILTYFWDFYKDMPIVKRRIEAYCRKYPNLPLDLKTALCNFVVKKGMNTEQVVILLGEPTHKKRLKGNEELWVYRGEVGDRIRIGEIQWYYKWGKLKFKDDTLIDIERQNIHIYK